MNNRLTIILVSALLLGSCTKETESGDQPEVKSVFVNLTVNTRAANDPMSINQDQTFSSLAIYIFDDDAGSALIQSALLPSFASISTKEIPIQTQIGVKTIYFIANYVGKTFRQTDGTLVTLNATTSRQVLENIVTESSGGFSPSTLLMVGKQTMTISSMDNGRSINVPLRRLQARVDVHVFKGPNFGSDIVTLESVTLHNQVLNSEVKFDYSGVFPQMLTSPMFSDQTVSGNTALLPYVEGLNLLPVNAQAIFYSYQNRVTQFSPVQLTAPYLEIKVNVIGITHSYTGYITDANQVNNKYSLLQNNVYQIAARLDVDSKIILNTQVLPWNQVNIEYERPITAADFSFGAWGASWGGINGKTMYTNVGGLEDAVFQFELKAPIGAAWVATLTNGLDFTFTSSTAGTAVTAVSHGFTNAGNPSLIAVRATKRWTGDSRDTEFYITVEGNEIPINPIVGLQRRYEGTDTRI